MDEPQTLAELMSWKHPAQQEAEAALAAGDYLKAIAIAAVELMKR
jgi:hypothetical protein